MPNQQVHGDYCQQPYFPIVRSSYLQMFEIANLKPVVGDFLVIQGYTKLLASGKQVHELCACLVELRHFCQVTLHQSQTSFKLLGIRCLDVDRLYHILQNKMFSNKRF